MNVSSISITDLSRRNMFIKYANQFMGLKAVPEENTEKNTDTKINSVKGLETLTIFPKQVIEGKTVITA